MQRLQLVSLPPPRATPELTLCWRVICYCYRRLCLDLPLAPGRGREQPNARGGMRAT